LAGPIANVELHVLDSQLRLVPVGVPGELYIGGVPLARGYLGRPELTAEKFVPHPFSDIPGARLYRTGDLARRRADGVLEFLGRADDQVKVRGFRIELGEIEAVLASHPVVREVAVVVVVREDQPGDKRLVAYVTGEAKDLGTAELRRVLEAKLPAYMVPSAFVALETLPLTPNGKVDRKALPAPDGARSELTTFSPPRTPTEELLAGIWAEVLRVEKVGRQDDFFDLGGHSLIATQVISRIRETLGVELPLGDLFEAPILAALAERIDTANQAGRSLKAPPLEPVSRTSELPLSFAQQRLWFLSQLEPNSPFYNIPLAVRFEGHLDAEALERSFGELIHRHESVRMTFRTQDGRPIQVPLPASELSLAVTDLRHLPADTREAEARRLAREEAGLPFDLARGPLLRASLLKLGEREHVLLLTLHHIISDGWSMGVLIREMAALYEAFSSGQPSPLPEPVLQYADYAAWQRRWLQGEALETQLSYWKQQLAGAPQLLELPTDRPRPATPSFRGAHLSARLPLSLTEALRELSRREGATLFMTLMSAFQVLLARYTGQQDVLVGTDIANRTRADTEGLIGFFINQLVMRGRLDEAPTFRELLARTRETALAAYAHQDLPFEELVRVLNPERGGGQAPLFQTKLILQNAPMSAIVLPGLTLKPLEVEANSARLDLLVALTETEEGLSCTWEYSTDLFEAATIERMAGHFQRLLEGIAAQPEQRLADVPLLSSEERQRLLVEWNDTRVEPTGGVCLHHAFEAQVARAPDALALILGDTRLSYSELDRRANQLAHHLRSLGVGPESRVALSVERSPELVIGILGILKAGGVYVPLDPKLPTERLAYMLDVSGASVVLTQQGVEDELPAGSRYVLCLDSGWEEIALQPETAPAVHLDGPNGAYVIFTSGSTGEPKGVLVEHRGVTNTVRRSTEDYGLRPGQRMLQWASMSFDVSVQEIFSTLGSGATLVMCPRQLVGEELLALVREHGVTALGLPPPALSVLPEAELPLLESVMTGGEASTAELMERWAKGRRFINQYGPTEVSIASTSALCTPGSGKPTLGRAILNTVLYVLDERMQPVPLGVRGELYIGGIGVARGYLGRPELTAERFLPNPFSSEPGARLYRTGDVVRYRADGNLEFCGRTDSQVKIRGFRIELGELESVLAEHPSLEQTVVLVREDMPGDKRLVAYVVPRPGPHAGLG
jgi:amino acid adenylation domain-containing protein